MRDSNPIFVLFFNIISLCLYMSFREYREDMRSEFRRKAEELNVLLSCRQSAYCRLIEDSSEPVCGLRCQIFEDNVLVRETGLEGINRRIVALRSRRSSIGSEKTKSDQSVLAEDIEKFNLETVQLISKLKTQIAVMTGKAS